MLVSKGQKFEQKKSAFQKSEYSKYNAKDIQKDNFINNINWFTTYFLL